jgi:hypothetical protein
VNKCDVDGVLVRRDEGLGGMLDRSPTSHHSGQRVYERKTTLSQAREEKLALHRATSWSRSSVWLGIQFRWGRMQTKQLQGFLGPCQWGCLFNVVTNVIRRTGDVNQVLDGERTSLFGDWYD